MSNRKYPKNNNIPIFFIGGRDRGFLWLKEMITNGENIVGASIMKEDAHEHVKYSGRIITLLKKHTIKII